MLYQQTREKITMSNTTHSSNTPTSGKRRRQGKRAQKRNWREKGARLLQGTISPEAVEQWVEKYETEIRTPRDTDPQKERNQAFITRVRAKLEESKVAATSVALVDAELRSEEPGNGNHEVTPTDEHAAQPTPPSTKPDNGRSPMSYSFGKIAAVVTASMILAVAITAAALLIGPITAVKVAISGTCAVAYYAYKKFSTSGSEDLRKVSTPDNKPTDAEGLSSNATEATHGLSGEKLAKDPSREDRTGLDHSQIISV